MALSVYVLAGYFKRETKSIEAALKYFVLGALSSGSSSTGSRSSTAPSATLDLGAIAALEGVPTSGPVGLGIFLVGFGMLFKIAAVPFHFWTPDVYEGAPTPVTAFMAVAPKAAAFAVRAAFPGRFRAGRRPVAGHRWRRPRRP